MDNGKRHKRNIYKINKKYIYIYIRYIYIDNIIKDIKINIYIYIGMYV